MSKHEFSWTQHWHQPVTWPLLHSLTHSRRFLHSSLTSGLLSQQTFCELSFLFHFLLDLRVLCDLWPLTSQLHLEGPWNHSGHAFCSRTSWCDTRLHCLTVFKRISVLNPANQDAVLLLSLPLISVSTNQMIVFCPKHDSDEDKQEVVTRSTNHSTARGSSDQICFFCSRWTCFRRFQWLDEQKTAWFSPHALITESRLKRDRLHSSTGKP